MKPFGSLILIYLICMNTASAQTDAEITDDLNVYWSQVISAVEEGDFDGYANTFHIDAVLVSDVSGQSYPIAKALSGWKAGFDSTANGEITVSLEFKMSKRLHDDSTAHETGIFKYQSTDQGGKTVTALIHFESLIIKQGNDWKMIMERQIKPASDDEWNALPDSNDE